MPCIQNLLYGVWQRIIIPEGYTEMKIKKVMTSARRDTLAAYAFLAPVIIGFLWFILYPMVRTLYMSFTKWTIHGESTFVGLQNWTRMFTDDRIFGISVRVTLTFTLWAVLINLVIGFILALLLNKPRKTVGLFRTIFYIPCMIAAGAPVMLVWLWIFDPDGMLNSILGTFGIQGMNWLLSQKTALGAIIATSAWGVGTTMIIYISGLKAVPEEYYESAEIDGAGYFRKLFGITIPILTPVILYNLIIGVIGAMQAFTQAYVLTRGGPRDSTKFFALNIYQQAFTNMNFGYASALAWLLFIAIMILTYVIFKTSARWVFYGDGMDTAPTKEKY